MKLRILLAMFALSFSGLLSAPAVAAPAAPTVAAVSAVQHAPTKACTKTSSGSCIRGGQFCPRASYGQSGYDAAGRRYVCKGDRSRPHWMRP